MMESSSINWPLQKQLDGCVYLPSVFGIMIKQCTSLTSLCLTGNHRLAHLGGISQHNMPQLKGLELDRCRLEPAELPAVACCQSVSSVITCAADVQLLTKWLQTYGKQLQVLELLIDSEYGDRIPAEMLLLLTVQCRALHTLRLCGLGAVGFPYYLRGLAADQADDSATSRHSHLVITDADLASLAACPLLSLLEFGFCEVTTAAMQHISAAPALTALSFKQVYFSTASSHAISSTAELMPDNGRRAELCSMLEGLHGQQGLTNLTIDRCWQPTDVAELWEGVGHLRLCNIAALENLQQLKISNCTPWLPDINHLSGLQQLTSLELKLLNEDIYSFTGASLQKQPQSQQAMPETPAFSSSYQQLLAHCLQLLAVRLTNSWHQLHEQLQAEALLHNSKVRSALQQLEQKVLAADAAQQATQQQQQQQPVLLHKVFEALFELCDATPALNRHLEWVQRTHHSDVITHPKPQCLGLQGLAGYQDAGGQVLFVNPVGFGSEDEGWGSDGISLDSAEEFGDDYDLRGYGGYAAAAGGEWGDEAAYDFEVAEVESEAECVALVQEVDTAVTAVGSTAGQSADQQGQIGVLNAAIGVCSEDTWKQLLQQIYRLAEWDGAQ